MARALGVNTPIPMPPRKQLEEAFDNLGTQIAVADYFDVSRPTLLKWAELHEVAVQSRPEIPRAKRMSTYLSRLQDRVRVAQWIADEGSVSSRYDSINDSTVLSVTGQMTDVCV